MNPQAVEMVRQPVKLNRRPLNTANFYISCLVFSTGLVLLFRFHMGPGAFRTGLEKSLWLFIHQVAAFSFLAGLVLHIMAEQKYITGLFKRGWRALVGKLKIRIILQISLFILALVVILAGFYPWIVMPGAALTDGAYHWWIDIHNRIGFIFLIGLSFHIAKRWGRIFRKKGNGNK